MTDIVGYCRTCVLQRECFPCYPRITGVSKCIRGHPVSQADVDLELDDWSSKFTLANTLPVPARVTLRMNPDKVFKLTQGRAVTTIRRGLHGRVGDYTKIGDCWFRIIDQLETTAYEWGGWRMDGYATRDELIGELERLYGAGINVDWDRLYVHVLARLPDTVTDDDVAAMIRGELRERGYPEGSV